MSPCTPEARSFILANTAIGVPPHVGEVRLYLANEAHELWLKTEEELDAIGLPPPFWAFAWAGGQGLARYILDNPGIVSARRVLDFATGSGLVAIAARLAGAAIVEATDTDHWCESAVALNCDLNGVDVAYRADSLIGTNEGWDVVLAGDVFYDRELGNKLLPWFETLRAAGTCILVGDPGRAYCPDSKLRWLADYDVSGTGSLEDSEVKHTTVWQFTGG